MNGNGERDEEKDVPKNVMYEEGKFFSFLKKKERRKCLNFTSKNL